VVPEGFMVQSTSPNEVLLKWNAPDNGLAYKVEYSTDGVDYNEVGETTAGEVVKRVTGLDANSEYHFRLTPVTSGLVAPAMVTTTTVAPSMVAQFNFAELAAGGTAIVEIISGAEETFIGDFSIEAVEEHLVMGDKDYKLEVNALKIHQDELGGINSYVRLYQSLLALTPSWLERSMTFWIKNNDPAAWTVPFSVEKRTGFGIAFKDEEIWAFTKHRPRYPAGTDWVADGVSHPYTSTDWTHVAYVYHDPYTSLFINGELVATSDGGDWVFPTRIEIEAGGDKSASLGALLDPDASMVEYLDDNWDPGARRFFDGMMADIRFFNHDLDEEAVAAIMMESLTDITNVRSTIMSNVRIYPNPATDLLYVDGSEKELVVNIYNIAGSMLISKRISNSDVIDVSSLTSGIYLLKINSGVSSEIRKISVVR
jgi:hypothetical protein